MPNHCSNNLYLESGKKISHIIKKYLDDETTTELDFNKIIPMPKELRVTSSPATKDENLKAIYKENMEKFGHETWYSWCVENWGTKWSGYDLMLIEDSCASFNTAWAPPIPVIRRLSQLTGETFVLDYVETGMDFIGRFVCGPDGEADEYYDHIDEAPQELKDSVGYEPWEEEEEELYPEEVED